MTLGAFIAWLLTGGGIGVLGYRLVAALDADWPWFAGLRYDWKRRLSFGIVAASAVLLGWGVIWLSVWLGLMAQPATPQVWVTSLFEIAATAVLSSQDAHGVGVYKQSHA